MQYQGFIDLVCGGDPFCPNWKDPGPVTPKNSYTFKQALLTAKPVGFKWQMRILDRTRTRSFYFDWTDAEPYQFIGTSTTGGLPGYEFRLI